MAALDARNGSADFAMTRFLVGLLLLVAAPTVRSADPAPATLADITRRLESGDPLVFATFGDSITFPASTDFRQNYITLTVDALRHAYPRLVDRHAGNMGTTTRVAESAISDTSSIIIRCRILMFGMNDCRAGYGLEFIAIDTDDCMP
jgi:hypothetical protein